MRRRFDRLELGWRESTATDERSLQIIGLSAWKFGCHFIFFVIVFVFAFVRFLAPFTTAPCACVTNQSTRWLWEECNLVFLVNAVAILPEAKDDMKATLFFFF